MSGSRIVTAQSQIDFGPVGLIPKERVLTSSGVAAGPETTAKAFLDNAIALGTPDERKTSKVLPKARKIGIMHAATRFTGYALPMACIKSCSYSWFSDFV